MHTIAFKAANRLVCKFEDLLEDQIPHPTEDAVINSGNIEPESLNDQGRDTGHYKRNQAFYWKMGIR